MKQYIPFLSLLYALGANASEDISQADGFFSRAESFSYSSANTLTALMRGDLLGPPPKGGTEALLRNSIEFGYRWKRFELSLIHRNDYNLYFSQESAEFAYLNKNRGVIPLEKLYSVDVEANQYQLTGAKLGYTFAFSNDFEVFGYYGLYHASEVVAGYLGKDPNGEGGEVGFKLVFDGEKNVRDLEGNVYANYVYTDDPLFQREVSEPSGIGYSVDIGFRWHLLPNLMLDVGFYDLLGEIYWEDLPHTEAWATTDVLLVDEDGYAVRPNFQGTEGFQDFTQDLTHRERALLDYRYKKYQFAYEFDRMKVVTFHRLIAGYHWSQNWGVQGSYDFTSEAIGFKLFMPAGQFGVMFDTLNFDDAYTLGLNWNFTYVF